MGKRRAWCLRLGGCSLLPPFYGARGFTRHGLELKDWALQWLRRIRELYRLNRQRLAPEADPAVQEELRQAVAVMRQRLDTELADPALRLPVRKVLTSLQEHWTG